MHESTTSAVNRCSVSSTAADDVLITSVGFGSTNACTPVNVLTRAPRLAVAGRSQRPVNCSDICCGTRASGSGCVHAKAVGKLLHDWNTFVAICQHTVTIGHTAAMYQAVMLSSSIKAACSCTNDDTKASLTLKLKTAAT